MAETTEHPTVSRRGFLRAALAATAVVGFDAHFRSWVKDIVRLIDFARSQGIQVAARGQGHSTLGQAQVEAGVVIDMSALAAIYEINENDALVGAGLRWSDLLRQTIPLGLAPPTLTDYIDLSVGGTLSVGGVGGQTFREGPQVDNVLELTVVTGRGEVVTCSPT